VVDAASPVTVVEVLADKPSAKVVTAKKKLEEVESKKKNRLEIN
jgi:hypothetical protein